MKYRIGELSNIMNVSKDMIRYYEKMGVINPSRTEDNNYREYEVIDALFLLSALKNHSYGLTIRDTVKLKDDRYMESFCSRLEEIEKQIEDEIDHKQLLLKKLKELKNLSVHCHMNLGNYWITEAKDQTGFFLTEGVNDEFERINEDPETGSIIFNPEYLPFIEFVGTFKNGKERWYCCMDDYYLEKFNITKKGDIKLTKQFCLCTIVDMGPIGTKDRDYLKGAYEYIEKHQLKVTGEPVGYLLGRVNDNNRQKRFLQIFIPIDISV